MTTTKIPSARVERDGLSVKFGLKMTDEQHRELKRIAYLESVSAADIIRDALDVYLADYRPRGRKRRVRMTSS